MSFSSARVGLRLTIIDSSRLVATLTGTFARFALRMIAFCSSGMFSSGTSRERSPRSMRISSDAARISSRFSTPRLLSILEMIDRVRAGQFAEQPHVVRTIGERQGEVRDAVACGQSPPPHVFCRKRGSGGAGTTTTALFEPILPPLTTTVSTPFGFDLQHQQHHAVEIDA